MAIENANPVKIAGTNLELTTTFIIATVFNGKVPNPYEKKLDVQFFVYEDAASWIANPNDNRIRVSELINNNHCKFTHNRTTDGDLDEFTDVQLKARLMDIFPTWDADLLTFQPPHEEVI